MKDRCHVLLGKCTMVAILNGICPEAPLAGVQKGPGTDVLENNLVPCPHLGGSESQVQRRAYRQSGPCIDDRGRV